MRILLLIALIAAQFGPRAPFDSAQRRPLSPAETLIEPAILRAIEDAPENSLGAASGIEGSDAKAGGIAVTCQLLAGCEVATSALTKLRTVITTKGLAGPSRSIWIATKADPTPPQNILAALHVAQGQQAELRVIRGFWSTAAIGDEVVELFARHTGSVDVRAFEQVGQSPLDDRGIPTTTIVAGVRGHERAASAAAASLYFLATMPNAGSEALLSHLTVGAHARLAEDGRSAVAQMGNQQRAGADVLIMFGQAIEREQRRIRSFAQFMPAPLDPMLNTRLSDMEKGITSVWTSMGITSSPYVPPAERIRGRGGEDRRVPARVGQGPLPTPEPPTAMLKFPNVADVIYELGNFIDGKRSISDIRDAVSAEFGPVALPVVVDYFERLVKTGAISIR